MMVETGKNLSLCFRSSMDRAFDYESKGWGFESLRKHSINKEIKMGKKSVGTTVNVPGVGKGTVESAPRIVKGVEVQEVRTDNHTVINVPTKKL